MTERQKEIKHNYPKIWELRESNAIVAAFVNGYVNRHFEGNEWIDELTAALVKQHGSLLETYNALIGSSSLTNPANAGKKTTYSNISAK